MSGCSEKNREIIWKNDFEPMVRKSGLKFTPGLELIGRRTVEALITRKHSLRTLVTVICTYVGVKLLLKNFQFLIFFLF